VPSFHPLFTHTKEEGMIDKKKEDKEENVSTYQSDIHFDLLLLLLDMQAMVSLRCYHHFTKSCAVLPKQLAVRGKKNAGT